MNNTLEVAQTILQQLGGRKFIAMTGARNFLGDANSLSFRLPGGGGFCKDGINYVKITLDANDTYSMDFRKIRGSQVKSVDVFSGLYFDMLQETFARITGLRVSL